MNSRRPVSPAILEGFYTNNRCGYCQHSIQSVGTEHSNTDDTTLENEYLQQLAGRIGSGTRSSFGLSAGQVPPELYDRMIQRNFRRSGDFFYWPLNWSGSCCPQYAIRLPASAFKLNKSQRSVISRFLRFCMETPRTTAEKTTAMDTIDETCAKTKDCSDELCDRLVDALREAIQSANLPQIPDTPFDKIHVKIDRSPKFGDLASPIVLALLGQYKKHGICTAQLSAKQLGELLKVQLGEIRGISDIQVAANGFINFYANLSANDSPKQQQLRQQPPFISNDKLPSKERHKLRLILSESSNFRQDEYDLYLRYQMQIHGDTAAEASRNQYVRFLCDSALVTTPINCGDDDVAMNESSTVEIFVKILSDSLALGTVQFTFTDEHRLSLPGYGSYHMRYELMPQAEASPAVLLAVSVIDILPTGLSSVYFIYDTTYKHLSLGVLSAVVETQLIAAMSSQLPSFQYYYMGFYIHQCSKMRYKGQYTPSEILCPITLQWTSLDDRVKRILNQHKYARLCADPAVPEAFATEPAFNLKQELIDHCLFVYQRIPLSGKIVGTVMSLGQEFENKLRQFAWLITPALAMRFIYLLAENDINLPCN